MNRKSVLISLVIVLIAEFVLLIGCSNKPGSTPTSSIPWENVKVYTDPNSLITLPVDQSFSIVVSHPMIPEVSYWESSDPSAFSLLDSKSLQPPSTYGLYTLAYLLKAVKVGKFQILFGTRDKLKQIHYVKSFNVEVNP
jgi:hypothetical protein